MTALGGALKSCSASDLAAAVLEPLVAGLAPERLGGLILGHAVQAGSGPNPARSAAQKAGLPLDLPAFTVNQGSASGLQAILQATLSLRAGACEQILAGGMESSSSVPYLLPSARWGTRMGAAPVLDALLQDGQPWPQEPPSPAEASYGRQSRARAAAAQEAGLFRGEIVPVTVTTRRGSLQLTRDELAGPDKVAGPGDGAALLLLASAPVPGAEPLARLSATAQGANSAQAIQRLLQHTGLTLAEIDRFELDEASPALPLQLLARFPALPANRVNLMGGALALGQPLGAAGARMLVTLAHQLRDNELCYGLAVMESHGSAQAMLLEHP